MQGSRVPIELGIVLLFIAKLGEFVQAFFFLVSVTNVILLGFICKLNSDRFVLCCHKESHQVSITMSYAKL